MFHRISCPEETEQPRCELGGIHSIKTYEALLFLLFKKLSFFSELFFFFHFDITTPRISEHELVGVNREEGVETYSEHQDVTQEDTMTRHAAHPQLKICLRIPGREETTQFSFHMNIYFVGFIV